jgi:hypothetical protein
MVSTRKQKQAAAETSDPLKDAGILQQVFAFLPGHYLFLGAVCREWNALYAGMADQLVRSVRLDGLLKLVACGPKSTLYSAAMASPATVRLACELGVCTEKKSLQTIAGVYADLETLAVLRELGMPLSEALVEGVALSGRLNILQH